MFSDGFVTEFSPSQYWSSLNFVTEFFSVKNFCDGFFTEISQNIVTDIISVTKNSVMEKVFPSQNCDGVLSLFRHNFVTNL